MSAANTAFRLAALVALGGCTLLPAGVPPEQDAGRRLDRALAALDAGYYAEAFQDLAWVHTRCAGREAGYRATAGLAAMELDPRNPAGRRNEGTRLLGGLIRDTGAPDWVRPLAESAYLLALMTGAPPAPQDLTEPGPRRIAAAEPEAGVPDEADPSRAPAGADTALPGERVRGCGSAAEGSTWVASRLPTLAGPSLTDALATAEAERAGAEARADSVAAELAGAQARLAETRAELERIRRTLTP